MLICQSFGKNKTKKQTKQQQQQQNKAKPKTSNMAYLRWLSFENHSVIQDHAMQSCHVVMSCPKANIVVALINLGSITSRCSGNEPTLIPEKTAGRV